MRTLLFILALFPAAVTAGELNYQSVEHLFVEGHMPEWQPTLFSGRCFRESNPEVPVAGLLSLIVMPARKNILLIGPGEGDSANMYEVGDQYVYEYAVEMLRRLERVTTAVEEHEGSLVSMNGRNRISLREGVQSYLVEWVDLRQREAGQPSTTYCHFSTEELR